MGTGKNNHPMLEMTQGNPRWSYCVVSDGGGCHYWSGE